MSMKSFILSLVIALCFASSAFASKHSFGLEMRMDFRIDGSNLDSDEDLNNESKGAKFRMNRTRINFRGTLNEKTKYRARFRMNRLEEESFDNTSELLQYWYIDRKITDNFTIRVGKQWLAMGSIEYSYIGMDQYTFSQTYLKVFGPRLYKTGLGLHYNLGKQRFRLQLLNSPFEEANQTSGDLNINFAWNGNFMNGMIKPIITYSLFPSPEQKALVTTEDDPDTTDVDESSTTEATTDAFTQTQWGAGTRLHFFKDTLQFEVELGNVTTPEYDDEISEDAGGTVLEETRDYQIVLVRYKADNLHPFLKLISESHDVDGEDVTDYSSQTLGLEYFPDGSIKTYRLHAAYSSSTEAPDEGDDIVRTRLNLGVSARF